MSTSVCESDVHPKVTPNPNHREKSRILKIQQLWSVCVGKGSYITHFNQGAAYGDESKELWEQVQSPNKYRRSDGQKAKKKNSERDKQWTGWLSLYDMTD